MLESVALKNFTTFSEAGFQFARGLNVLVGENGTGKTHVLKLAYCVIYVCARGNKELGSSSPTNALLQTAIANKLYAVFKPDDLSRLGRHDHRGRRRYNINCVFSSPAQHLQFLFNSGSGLELTVNKVPSSWLDKLPVYLPTRELLTIYPGFVSLYETTHLPFEETWRDTCVLLGAPLARGPREKRIKELLVPLEEAMGGKVELTESGRFYLNIAGGPMEMHLTAEGLRKLAMIARLIANGSLVDDGFLFWDEPESNLNPKTIKVIARTILHLCRSGIQVFVASHSLFLIRELDILLQSDEFKEIKARFFGLHPGDHGIRVMQGDTVNDVGEIDALQEELSQADRYLETESK